MISLRLLPPPPHSLLQNSTQTKFNPPTRNSAMEILHTSFSLIILLFIINFPSLSLSTTDYTPPDHYFINCGSNSNTQLPGRNFLPDVNPTSFSLSGGRTTHVSDANPLPSTPQLYQTARIFNQRSFYDLDISQNGIYMVRFHFYPFQSSPNNLSTSNFNVSASGFSLLSNFRPNNTTNLPIIHEFLLKIDVGKFKIFFTPSQESSFAFVSAIEAFLTPTNFIPDSAPHVTISGNQKDYSGLMSHVLRPIHRINVGGTEIIREDNTLWRKWVTDDEYIYSEEAAVTKLYTERLNYEDGGATKYDAPDLVYKTAKEVKKLNNDPERVDRNNNINVSWSFNVGNNSTNLVRAHFCDIFSPGPNVGKFNLYIFTQFSHPIQPSYVIRTLAAPFYLDFVVDSDSSGYVNISIGSPRGSNDTAFLNGLEIMEVKKDLDLNSELTDGERKKKTSMGIVIGAIAGGVGFLVILVGVLLICMKCRKAKPVEQNGDWKIVPQYGGDSFSMVTDRTGSNVSPLPNLNLGLKVPFAEIQQATQNFNPKLVIGEGGFGKVYKGVLTNGVKVAVKRSEPGHGQGLPEFQTEIMVLSRIRHKHLVALIGYCDERSEMILVYEFMEKGTLREHLYGSDGDRDTSHGPISLPWNQRLEICIGAANGLNYLHTGAGGIIHRDVKSTNILLDEHYVAKVADFGISRLGPVDPSQNHVSTEIKGSFGYLDPEYYRCQNLTQKSDVYSFGVVLLEVLCARPALNNLLPREEVNLAEWGVSWIQKGEVEKIVDPTLAGKINLNSLRKFGETVDKCLKEYGDERPSMIDVLWDLQYSLQLHQNTVVREAHEDSTINDESWDIPMRALHRLPSRDIGIDDSVVSVDVDESVNSSYTKSVFSQLKMDDAR